jgi:hypothetical protein
VLRRLGGRDADEVEAESAGVSFDS